MADRDGSSCDGKATPANRLGLDYRAEARRLSPPPVPIIDIHAHVTGPASAVVYREAADCFGVERVYSMTAIDRAEVVREVLGDRIRFIAVPSFMDPDRDHAFREGFLENIAAFHDRLGSRIVKFFVGPRFRDYWEDGQGQDVIALDSPWRIRAAELAQSLGMMFMVHVGDPDTWFKVKYADAGRYGTKASQYEALERMLDRFDSPWIAAHMGGWPERLDLLSGLLERHPNLYLDTSATKWMVRELSRHPQGRLVGFLTRWRGRVLFGSDIVAADEHLSPESGDESRPVLSQASDAASAFDLYASRYWALRTLLETDYDGPSPIADPDLEMVDPDRFDAMSAPRLVGKRLPREILEAIYSGTATDLVLRWEAEH